MHELAITQSMVDIVLEQAEKEGAKRVEAISLTIGELSGFVEESVQFYFGFLSKGTLAEGAELTFNSVPARVRCRNCEQIFHLKELDWSCPHCGQSNLEIMSGKELYVDSIEIE